MYLAWMAVSPIPRTDRCASSATAMVSVVVSTRGKSRHTNSSLLFLFQHLLLFQGGDPVLQALIHRCRIYHGLCALLVLPRCLGSGSVGGMRMVGLRRSALPGIVCVWMRVGCMAAADMGWGSGRRCGRGRRCRAWRGRLQGMLLLWHGALRIVVSRAIHTDRPCCV
mgnify:CR=1 FL=1